MVPGIVAIVPLAMPGHTCRAKTLSIFGAASSTPACTMANPPAPPSSAGWNKSFTVPGSVCSRSLRMRAAVSSIAVCASCPHACIFPVDPLLNGDSISSQMGSASMSARRATHGALPVPTVATIPVRATGYSYATSISSSVRRTYADVAFRS